MAGIDPIASMRDTYAYAFTSTLSLSEIRTRLNAIGPWKWIERDNDRLGEYISAGVMRAPDFGIVKIFVEPDHYALNVRLESDFDDAEECFAKVRDILMHKSLPAIEASNIRDVDTYD